MFKNRGVGEWDLGRALISIGTATKGDPGPGCSTYEVNPSRWPLLWEETD